MTNDAAGQGPVLSEGLGALPERARLTAAHLLEGIVFAPSAIQNEQGVRMNAARDLQACAAEIERLRGEVAMLRATMEGATYQLSKARIWGGMEWHYNPLHPIHYRPALDSLRKVLDGA